MSARTAAKLAEFRAQYLKQLDQRLAAIRAAFAGLDPAAWQVEQARTLHRLVHGLTGSAGTFGLAAVSDAARRLENALANTLDSGQAPDAATWQAIAEALDRLERRVAFSLTSDAQELPSPELLPRPQRAPLIHLVEDDLPQAEFLRLRLMSHGFRVRHFSDPADFSAIIRSKLDERPAAVVMDMIFAQGDTAGATTIATLGLGAGNGVPVVFVSVRDDISARLAAFRAGASRYLAKPLDADQLCSQLDTLTGRMPSRPFRVLLVNDESTVLDFHAAVLREAGFETFSLSRPLETLDALARFVPDVVVLDVYMPEASGPELAAVIRENDGHMNLPILFLSAEADLSKQLLALNLGGDDFLFKPVRPEHLVTAVSARARRARMNTETLQRLQINLYEREREQLAFDQHALITVTDAAGLITYANPAFCRVSGYRLEELHGQDHNILKSGQHPAAFYQDLWSTIKSGKVWQGEVCDRRKDGRFFWMVTTITPFLDADGKVYQYVAIRTDITVAKESEEALRIAKERLRRGQIFANVGTWDWTIPTGALFWSERIAPLFGYAEGELETSYENFLAAVHPDDRQHVIDAVNACVAHDQPYDIEHRVVWPDGTVRWLLERGAVERDAAGQPLRMLGVVTDIDDRKTAELALAERTVELGRFKHVLDSTLDMIFMFDAETLHFVYLNDGAVRSMGYPREELLRLHPYDIKPDISPEEFRQIIAPLLSGEKPSIKFDTVHRRKDGSDFPVSIALQLVREEGERGLFVAIVRDISERLQAERELSSLAERLKLATRAARLGIWDWNIQKNALYWDDRMFELYGAARADFSGAFEAWIARVHPEDRARCDEALRCALQEGAAYDIDFRISLPGGGLRYIKADGSVFRDAQDRPVRMLGSNYDITAQKVATAVLQAAKVEAERANQAKSDFLSSMSHELRSPLNFILGFAQVLEHDGALGAEQRQSVAEILKAGQHLQELIDAAFELVRIDAGRLDLLLAPLALVPVVEECREFIEPRAARRRIALHVELAPGLVVLADHMRFRQALLQLLTNAVKYNREAGEIRLAARADAGLLRLTVSDTGPGIAAERLPDIFKPFERLGVERSEIAGSGIGLTIAQRLVEAMGGSIEVASAVGFGTTFSINLPLAGIGDTH